MENSNEEMDCIDGGGGGGGCEKRGERLTYHLNTARFRGLTRITFTLVELLSLTLESLLLMLSFQAPPVSRLLRGTVP